MDRRAFLSRIGGVASVAIGAGVAGCSSRGQSTGGQQSDASVQQPAVSVPELGASSAEVTVSVFVDFACPHCRAFHQDIFPQLREAHISPGEVVYRHRNFPIPVHNTISWRAPHAAHAVQAAAGESAFFEYVDRLFDNQESLSPERYGALVRGLEVDASSVRTAATGRRYEARVQQDRQYGEMRGVTSTPTVLVDQVSVEPAYTAIAEAIESAQE